MYRDFARILDSFKGRYGDKQGTAQFTVKTFTLLRQTYLASKVTPPKKSAKQFKDKNKIFPFLVFKTIGEDIWAE
jgi:hypothetical protein